MERTLLLLSFALGGVVWLCGFLTAGIGRARQRGVSRTLSIFWVSTAVSLPVLVFLATLPVHPPIFAAGHGLGSGFLVGGLLGLLGAWTALRALQYGDDGQQPSGAAAVAAPIGLALMGSTIPSLWMRDSLLDALCGIAIGWLCAVLLVIKGATSQPGRSWNSASPVCLALSAGAAVLFCSVAGMGELGGLIDLVGKAPAAVHWSAPGLAFIACLCVLMLFALLPAMLAMRMPLLSFLAGWIERGRDSEEARARSREAWRTGVCAVVVLLIGRLVANRFTEVGDETWKTRSTLLKPLYGLIGPNPMFHVIALGVFAAILVNWLVRDHYRNIEEAHPLHPIRDTNVLAVLVLCATGLIAFQLMGGFGLCLAFSILVLTAGLTVAAVLAAIHEDVRGDIGVVIADAAAQLRGAPQITRMVLFGALLGLYRLFSVRFDSELRGVGLTDHYALFGILFGAALPPFLAAYLNRASHGETDGEVSNLTRLAATGALVLVLPTLIIALWGTKCALALLIGLALSTMFESSLVSALLALAVALAMAQWTHHILPLAQLTRDQKVGVLFWTAAISVIVLLISEFVGRKRNPAGSGGVATQSGGGAQ